MTYQNTYSLPDAEEHKLLRKHYFRLAWIMIVLVLVFSGLNTLIMTISSGIMGGSFTEEGIKAGKQILRATPVMYAIYSYGFPIAADIAALGIGLLITKADLKSRLKTAGLSGKGFLGATAMTFSVATIAAFVNLILIFALMAAMGKLSDFSIENTTSVSIAPKGNPLWLDVLIYIYICLLGPILEELIFRGVLLEGLRKYGNLFGIIMSAVMFGLMHQNIAQCLPAVSIGLVWGYIAVKSGSLLPSILLHILNNTMSAVLLVVIQSVNINDLSNMAALLNVSVSLMLISSLISLFRLACVVGSIIIIVRYTSSAHGKLVETNGYTKARTWKYLFTSLPWLVIMGYLLVTTVTSISHLA
ncbi:MAG: lysostaphin resistance A-like protein [Huintestinicola sp.]|uniref:CPBP family intramembrane glutamic endopeptidase n=1 Tax=Huintestinicola sp. TaxID=2981661 RepID=UPI003EFDBC47